MSSRWRGHCGSVTKRPKLHKIARHLRHVIASWCRTPGVRASRPPYAPPTDPGDFCRSPSVPPRGRTSPPRSAARASRGAPWRRSSPSSPIPPSRCASVPRRCGSSRRTASKPSRRTFATLAPRPIRTHPRARGTSRIAASRSTGACCNPLAIPLHTCS